MNHAQLFQTLLQQGNNPIFNRAVQMVQGKSEEEIKQVVKNMAQQRGMNVQQLESILGQFGLRL